MEENRRRSSEVGEREDPRVERGATEWQDARAKASIPDRVISDPETLRSIRLPRRNHTEAQILHLQISPHNVLLRRSKLRSKIEQKKNQRRRTLSNNARIHFNEMD